MHISSCELNMSLRQEQTWRYGGDYTFKRSNIKYENRKSSPHAISIKFDVYKIGAENCTAGSVIRRIFHSARWQANLFIDMTSEQKHLQTNKPIHIHSVNYKYVFESHSNDFPPFSRQGFFCENNFLVNLYNIFFKSLKI